jgi:hypothetical protein
MNCEDDGTLRIWIESVKQSVSCTVRDETKNVTGYTGYIKCPDPKVVCGLFRFEKTVPMPAPTLNPTGVAPDPTGVALDPTGVAPDPTGVVPDPAEASSNTVAIVSTVVAVFVVITVVVGIIVWRRLHRKQVSAV